MRAFILAAAFAAVATIPALAKPPVAKCVTDDTKESFEIIGIGDNKILFSMNGGDFYNGMASGDETYLKFVIPLDKGMMAVVIEMKTGIGRLGIVVDDKKDAYDVKCTFNVPLTN